MTIALWAVPRSVSTAFERVFAERGDFEIVHEPFFDAYERRVGREVGPNRPGFEYRSAVAQVRRDVLKRMARRSVFVKDMAYHVEPAATPGFLAPFKNAFIIRHPLLVYRSLRRLRPPAAVEPNAYLAQLSLYRLAKSLGNDPIVVWADDFVTDPTATMSAFCQAVDIDFLGSAMEWRPGYRREWYDGKESYWEAERRWYVEVAESRSVATRQTEASLVDEDIAMPYPGYDRDLEVYQCLKGARLRIL